MGPNSHWTKTLSPFTINLVFLWLSIIGISVIPFLTVKLQPSRSYNTISVNFSWRTTSAEAVEQAITGRLEAAFSTIKGLEEINSTSGNGYGYLYISFDGSTDIKEVQYEIATLIRNLYRSFPEGVSYPQVYTNKPSGNEAKRLLSYFASAPVSSWQLGQYLEKKVAPVLANTEGVYQVNISGVQPVAISLKFDRKVLSDLQITEDDIRDAINSYLSSFELGRSYLPDEGNTGTRHYFYLSLKVHDGNMPDWQRIPVKKSGSRIIFIADITTASFIELPPSSYFRINGKSAITLDITATEKFNYLQLARNVKAKIALLRKNMPEGYDLILAYDQTEFLKAELQKISLRTLATISILFLFVFLMSRSWRYLLLIAISLIVNLLIAAICYYLLRIEIHLYTLAAITVSMGMIIDGTIVMIDHLRNTGNRKVFLALTGAHVTTIGSVCIIFLLKEEQRIYLEEFAWVMIINLLVSLPVALFLIPALMDKLPLPKRYSASGIRRKRKSIWWNNLYLSAVNVLRRRRAILVLVMLLIFGLPVYLLPGYIEDPRNGWSKAYNAVMTAGGYNGNVKMYMDKWLGGCLGLFLQRSKNFVEPSTLRLERTTLTVKITMPKGATLAQMNVLVSQYEDVLQPYTQIQQFDCQIPDGEHATITIRFHRKAEEDGFPRLLKKELETKAIYTGLADFIIVGAGQGFDNSRPPETMNYGITLYGYNYERLTRIADTVKEMLLQNQRVEKVSVRSSRTSQEGERPEYEMVFKVFNKDQLLLNTKSNSTFYHSINSLSGRKSTLTIPVHNAWIPLIIEPKDSLSPSIWNALNQPILTDKSAFVKLKTFSAIEKERIGSEIVRNNQQYQLVVNYNFIGDNTLGDTVLNRAIRQVRKNLPIGYSVMENQQGYWQEGGMDMALSVLITIGIIFLLSAILLNSIRQALVVITMIPISFIGVFLVVQFFHFNFDEGGFASFILLSGIVVNWALFILNDYNNFSGDKKFLGRPHLRYLKSFNLKIAPILLSAASSLLGFIPFLVNGRYEPFWYSLAICSVGGLLFSVLATVVIMPVFLPGWEKATIHLKKDEKW